MPTIIWNLLRQSGLAVSIEQIPLLGSQIEAIIAQGHCGRFVLESAAKLRRIVHHCRCYWNLGKYVAPVCNAPWTSAVIEADGTVRPCFFHRSIGSLKSGQVLKTILNGPDALEFRSTLDVALNPLCRQCVCSLYWDDGKTVPIPATYDAGERNTIGEIL